MTTIVPLSISLVVNIAVVALLTLVYRELRGLLHFFFGHTA